MSLSLDVIREPDEFCKPCGMHKECNHPVMNGEGTEDPIWEFVGEAPGADEDDPDHGGYPFKGEAGLILREAIEEVGIPAKKCRFTNAVRCRPPKNDLKKWPDAIDHCRPHLLRELRATRPKVVILLGNSAIQSVLNKKGIMKMHGHVINAGLYKIVCCFHPSYLLRNNNASTKAKFIEALQTAKDIGQPRKIPKAEALKHITIQDKKTLYEMTDFLKKQKYLASDIEGSTLSAFSKARPARLGMVGWAWDDRHAVCYPVYSRVGIKIKVHKEEMLEAIKEIHECPSIRHILHFGKYDYVYEAALYDIWIGGKEGFGYYADTGQMSYVLNERPGGHSLDDWSYKVGMPGYKQEIKQYQMEHPETNPNQGGNMLDVPYEIIGPYNMNDCIAALRLFWKLRHDLKKQKLWERPFKFPQMWHNWTASIMEINGLKIDEERNIELDEIFRERITKVEDSLHDYDEIRKLQKIRDQDLMLKIYEKVKSYKRPVPSVRKKVLELFENIKPEERIVNLNSPDYKRKLIFDILGYKSLWKTPSGKNESVEKEVLVQLNASKPSKLLTKLIDCSELNSAYSKYVGPVRGWIGTDGRTHTTYKPQGQVTGRVSSEDPNHENLPKHGRLAMELRSQFVSSGDEYFILEEDSKQGEMRLFCDRAQDDIMTEEFNAGKDPHAMGAMAAFEISEAKWLAMDDKKRKHLRFLAKSAVSFGLLYGRGAPALAADFQQSVKWAEKFIDRYFAKYDDCRRYIKEREKYIKKHGIVYSHFFRPRRLPEVESDTESVVARAVREGINSPIQGDLSDITWVALHRLAAWLRKYKMKSKACIAVHDAGYVDTYYKEIDDVAERLAMYMTDRDFIHKMTGWYCSVPLDTDCSLGSNLGAMVELQHGSAPGQFIVPSNFR